MYFPYFRGKQYELISVRENAQRMSEMGIVPIVEPVKENLNGLKRAFKAVHDEKGRAILVVNPQHGDHSDGPKAIEEYAAELAEDPRISIGIVLTPQTSVPAAVALCKRYAKQRIALIHAGFSWAGDLAKQLGEKAGECTHVFLDTYCGKLYRRHFANGERVLIRDGFVRRKNREHPDLEPFSDLHVTYLEESVNGFGDFLVVGDDYSESGGPAYAVAIHLTFIDPSNDDEMYIRHFKSDRSSSPTDPAGKFAEALEKLVREVTRPGSNILRTSAVTEFLDLHGRRHFPGLGSLKKLSMNHHIETLADYFQKE